MIPPVGKGGSGDPSLHARRYRQRLPPLWQRGAGGDSILDPVHIHRHRVLRHVRVVQPPAGDPLAPRPGAEGLQVLAQAVGERLGDRAGGRVAGAGTRSRARRGRTRLRGRHAHEPPRLDLDQEEPALDRAVVQGVRLRRPDADAQREAGVAGEERRLPAGEALAEHRADLLVERPQLRLRAETLAVRRVDRDEARHAAAALRRHGVGQLALLDVDVLRQPGVRDVGEGRAHRRRVAVGADDRREPPQPGLAPRVRLRHEALPEARHVPRPAREAEALAQQARRDVPGEQRGLDRQGPRAAHRVEQRPPRRRDRRPAGADQHRGSEVLLERRGDRLRAVAPPVEALAGEVERHARLGAVEVDVDPQIRLRQVDRGAPPVALAKAVDDGVLDLLRPEDGVRDRRAGARKIDRERAVGREVLLPGEGADAGVERRGVDGRDGAERQQDARGEPRPEAGAVGGLERPGEGDAGDGLLHPRGAERGQLGGQQPLDARAGRWRTRYERCPCQGLYPDATPALSSGLAFARSA